MAKRTVQDLLIERLDRFETKFDSKMDDVMSKIIPDLLVEVAKITTTMKEEARAESKVDSTKTRIWGGEFSAA